MALVMEEGDVCNSWEDIEDNSALLEKQLARLQVSSKNPNDANGFGRGENTGPITIDSTREESLRTQYAPPEPKLKILARPKGNRSSKTESNSVKTPKSAPAKTLQQREEEYAAARMRILGDVRFEAEEAEAEMEAALSPAEILKLKVAEAMGGDSNNVAKRPVKSASVQNGIAVGSAAAENGDHNQNPAAQNGDNQAQQQGQQPHPRRNKRSREKFKTTNPEPQRDFPVPKTESDRIIRHPRGPDGSAGFTNYRS